MSKVQTSKRRINAAVTYNSISTHQSLSRIGDIFVVGRNVTLHNIGPCTTGPHHRAVETLESIEALG